MENAKQKAIELAYIELFGNLEDSKERYDAIKRWIDYFGWFSGNLKNISPDLIDMSGYEQRPISLRGIENNNGWISINSESDLPDENCECFLYFKDGNCYTDIFILQYGQFSKHHWRYITHYQKINTPSKPIY